MEKAVKLYAVLRMLLFERIFFLSTKMQTWLISLAALQLRYSECEYKPIKHEGQMVANFLKGRRMQLPSSWSFKS